MRQVVIGRWTCALARDVCRVAEMQDLVLGHALLAVQDQAVPGLHGLLCLGALCLQEFQLGAEALAGELTVLFVLLDVLLHMRFTCAAILVAPLGAALVVAVEVALHLVVPLKDEAVITMAER